MDTPWPISQFVPYRTDESSDKPSQKTTHSEIHQSTNVFTGVWLDLAAFGKTVIWQTLVSPRYIWLNTTNVQILTVKYVTVTHRQKWHPSKPLQENDRRNKTQGGRMEVTGTDPESQLTAVKQGHKFIYHITHDIHEYSFLYIWQLDIGIYHYL